MAGQDQYNEKSKPRKADNLDHYQPDDPRPFTPEELEQHKKDNEALYQKYKPK